MFSPRRPAEPYDWANSWIDTIQEENIDILSNLKQAFDDQPNNLGRMLHGDAKLRKAYIHGNCKLGSFILLKPSKKKRRQGFILLDL